MGEIAVGARVRRRRGADRRVGTVTRLLAPGPGRRDWAGPKAYVAWPDGSRIGGSGAYRTLIDCAALVVADD